MERKKPKLIVFDLDYTLWPFWVDTHVTPPFRKSSNGDVVDLSGSKVDYYPQVPDVLKNLHEQGYVLAVASRTGEIQGARQLVELFGWEKYFKYKEIFPGSKTTHITNIKRQSGTDFSEMLFFDDEQRNISDVSKLGVVSIYVRTGVGKKIVEDGLLKFANQRS